MNTRNAESVLAELGARTDGIVRVADARAAGLSRRSVDHQIATGRVRRVGRGVLRLRDHPVSWRSELRAALLLGGPGAAVGLRSAARLHGLYAHREDTAIEIVIPRGRDHRSTLGRFAQTRHLPPSHVTTVDGFPVTTLARTCFDLAGDPPATLRGPVGALVHERHMAAVVNDALGRRGLTFAAEVAVLIAHGKRGRSGTRIVRRLLRRFGPRYEPTRSDGESLFVELIAEAAWPVPEKQVPLADEHGWIGTVDFLFTDRRVVVEVDSRWHDGPIDEERDEERDRRLRSVGYDVRRVRYGTLVTDPGPFLRMLRSALT